MSWHAGNRYLSKSEMQDNALYIRDYLLKKGWSLNAICGLLGNTETESTNNPALWESREEGNTARGYGLTQWTPATKFIDWCNANNRDIGDMDANLDRILWEVENGGQFYPTQKYPMTFKDGSQTTPASVQDIIDAYCKYMVDIANDNTHGYSQKERSLYNYTNPTSFDCSSLVCTAVQYAFDLYKVTPTPKSCGCTNTRDMLNLQNCGFEIEETNPRNCTNAKKGDVELTPASHTGVYLGNNEFVHASTDYGTNNTTDDNGKEICTRSWYSHPWAYRLRFTGKGVTIDGSSNPDIPDPEKPINNVRRLSKILLYEG